MDQGELSHTHTTTPLSMVVETSEMAMMLPKSDDDLTHHHHDVIESIQELIPDALHDCQFLYSIK